MYEDLLGERPKPKKDKEPNVKDEKEIDLEMEVGGSSVPEEAEDEGKPVPEADPWKDVADDLDLEDLEDMDDCDGDCDNCDLSCPDLDEENPEGC